jgi:hypothetical protein
LRGRFAKPARNYRLLLAERYLTGQLFVAMARWQGESPRCRRYRKAGGVVEPCSLRSATIRGKLCQQFRESNRTSGFADNLTASSFCKVCSVDRKALEKWPQNPPRSIAHRTDCIGRL